MSCPCHSWLQTISASLEASFESMSPANTKSSMYVSRTRMALVVMVCPSKTMKVVLV